MCAHNQLFLPAVAEAKAVLEAGTIGRVYEVRTTDSFFNDFDPANMGWRASAATSGGGELIDTGYHPTYLLLHLAGGAPAEVDRDALDAPARRSWRARTRRRCSSASTTGSVGQMATSWAYDPAPVTERFSAVGERGALHSDGTALTVAVRGGDDDDADVRSGRQVRRRDRPLRRLPRARAPAAAHRARGDRGARDHPRRLRGRADPARRPGHPGLTGRLPLMERTAFRTCPFCEATCGLEVTLRGDEVVKVRGDGDDVFSRGFLCPKGVALQGPARGPRPAAHAAGPRRRRRARARELGGGVGADRRPPAADRGRARPRRRRRLHRQPRRPRARRAALRPRRAQGARHPQRLLGQHGRPAAEGDRLRADVRDAACRSRSPTSTARCTC